MEKKPRKKPLTWLRAEALIEEEIAKVRESADWTTRQQEVGYSRALILLRRYRKTR